jgi:tRNA pseudouridine38-40 synthase
VRVRRTSLAPDGFDARFSALARTYRYRLADGASGPTRCAATCWPGRARWTSRRCRPPRRRCWASTTSRRTASAGEGASTVRALLELDWERDADDLLVMTIRADAFCHSMVRSVVGAMLAVGEGRRPPPGRLVAAAPERATDVAVARRTG